MSGSAPDDSSRRASCALLTHLKGGDEGGVGVPGCEIAGRHPGGPIVPSRTWRAGGSPMSPAARAVASRRMAAMAAARGAKTRSISRRRGSTCGQRGSDASRKCSLSGWGHGGGGVEGFETRLCGCVFVPWEGAFAAAGGRYTGGSKEDEIIDD